VTVTNNGDLPLPFIGLSLAGSDGGAFADSNTCGAMIPAHGSCQVGVTFKPSATGGYAALLKLADGVPDSPQLITITGTGVRHATDTTLSAPAAPAIGSQVELGATVNPVPNGGTIAFSDGGTPIPGCGSQPVNATTGAATCAVTYTTAGAHVITATYSGDPVFAGSSGGANLTVAQLSSVTNHGSAPAPTNFAAGKHVATPVCVVPHLRHLTLAQARMALKHAHCGLGSARRPKHVAHPHVLHVRTQSVPFGSHHVVGYPVNVWLG
jgi:Bacterial Ig-like domain (group 3)